MKYQLNIVHLYPREMNIYGDRGNITALTKRLEWRGYEAKLVEVGVSDSYDFGQADIIFAGGGQDSGQLAVAKDLSRRTHDLKKAADEGTVMLMVCGSYQLFGRWFVPQSGDRLDGIGLFAAETRATDKRLIGNIVINTAVGELVGFENHSGQTRLDVGQASLGQVMRGFGNNEDGIDEGAIYRNVFGTYLHGSLLPKNPLFADHLLTLALNRKYPDFGKLSALDDSLEQHAAAVAKSRP